MPCFLYPVHIPMVWRWELKGSFAKSFFPFCFLIPNLLSSWKRTVLLQLDLTTTTSFQDHVQKYSQATAAVTWASLTVQTSQCNMHFSKYSQFSRDVTAAMLVYITIAKKVFWEFDSIIMQNLSDILPWFCTPTWPSHHVSENQE